MWFVFFVVLLIAATATKTVEAVEYFQDLAAAMAPLLRASQTDCWVAVVVTMAVFTV